jgi:hypothetical protein
VAKARRKLFTLEKGPKERNKKGKGVAKVHKKIFDRYPYVCIEDLNTKKRMTGRLFQQVLQMRIGIGVYNTQPCIDDTRMFQMRL